MAQVLISTDSGLPAGEMQFTLRLEEDLTVWNGDELAEYDEDDAPAVLTYGMTAVDQGGDIYAWEVDEDLPVGIYLRIGYHAVGGALLTDSEIIAPVARFAWDGSGIEEIEDDDVIPPVTVITTPKSANANSYLSLTDANDILSGRLFKVEWTDASSNDKRAALVWATRIIDMCFEWKGHITSATQALAWPRSAVVDQEMRYLDPDEIPILIQRATAEMALELIRKDRTKDPAVIGLGLRSIEIGRIGMTVDAGLLFSLVPRTILLLLTPLGITKPGISPGARIAHVRRS